MYKMAGDLLLRPELIKVSVLTTQLIDFLFEKLGELRSSSLGLTRLMQISGMVPDIKACSQAGAYGNLFSKFNSQILLTLLHTLAVVFIRRNKLLIKSFMRT